MASLADLPGTAAQILAAFVTQLKAQKGFSLPERRYVAPGSQIVWDGEQFTVALMGIDQGQPGAGFGGSFVPEASNFFVQFSVNLVREVQALQADGPGLGMVPSDGEMDEDGQTSLGDATVLMLAATAIHQAYVITGPGEGMVIGPLQPLGPEGGLVATRLLLSLSLT